MASCFLRLRSSSTGVSKHFVEPALAAFSALGGLRHSGRAAATAARTGPRSGPASPDRRGCRRRYSSVERSGSVSSSRRMKLPPALRAISQLNSAARRLPICRKPVGEGAKRVMTGRDKEPRGGASAGSRNRAVFHKPRRLSRNAPSRRGRRSRPSRSEGARFADPGAHPADPAGVSNRIRLITSRAPPRFAAKHATSARGPGYQPGPRPPLPSRQRRASGTTRAHR